MLICLKTHAFNRASYRARHLSQDGSCHLSFLLLTEGRLLEAFNHAVALRARHPHPGELLQQRVHLSLQARLAMLIRRGRHRAADALHLALPLRRHLSHRSSGGTYTTPSRNKTAQRMFVAMFQLHTSISTGRTTQTNSNFEPCNGQAVKIRAKRPKEPWWLEHDCASTWDYSRKNHRGLKLTATRSAK